MYLCGIYWHLIHSLKWKKNKTRIVASIKSIERIHWAVFDRFLRQWRRYVHSCKHVKAEMNDTNQPYIHKPKEPKTLFLLKWPQSETWIFQSTLNANYMNKIQFDNKNVWCIDQLREFLVTSEINWKLSVYGNCLNCAQKSTSECLYLIPKPIQIKTPQKE